MESISNVQDIQELLNRQADVFASLKRINANANERIRMPSFGYECPICHNRTFSFSAQWLEGYEPEGTLILCKCRKPRKSIVNLYNSGLTIEGLKEHSLEAFKAVKPYQKQMLEAAQTYIKSANTDKWFALLGASGSGKTHLCSAVCYDLLRHGKEVYYMQWRDDIRQIMQDQYNGNRDLLDRVKTVGVLYIDDLFKTARDPEGKQKPSEAETRLAFEIINSRYTTRKKTIISSESVIEELVKIDEAVAGRIKQMCGYYIVNIQTVKGENRNYRMLD